MLAHTFNMNAILTIVVNIVVGYIVVVWTGIEVDAVGVVVYVVVPCDVVVAGRIQVDAVAVVWDVVLGDVIGIWPNQINSTIAPFNRIVMNYIMMCSK